MMAENLKGHGINISLSTMATLIPVLTVIWFIIKPALLVSISTAVAEDLQVQVAVATAPLQNAFKRIIKSDIDKLKRAIARLEYQQKYEAESWTSTDAEALTELRIELQGMQEAYAEL